MSRTATVSVFLALLLLVPLAFAPFPFFGPPPSPQLVLHKDKDWNGEAMDLTYLRVGTIDANFLVNRYDVNVLRDANIEGDLNVFGSFGVSGQSFLSNFLNLHAEPEEPLHAATKEYVDIAVSGIEFDFFLTDSVSDISDYNVLVDMDTDAAESSITSADLSAGLDQLIFNFATVAGEPEFKTLLSSVYDGHFHFQKTGGAPKTVNAYWKLFERDSGGAESELLLSETSSVITSKSSFDIHAVLGDDESIDGNRLVLKVYANVLGGGAAAQVIVFMEGTTVSHISLRPPNTALSQLYLERGGGNWMTGDLNLGGLDLNNVRDVNASGDGNFENIGLTGNFYCNGDANVIGGVQAAAFYGSGAGLTGITSTPDINGEDLDVQDVNSRYLEADKFFGDGAGLTGVTSTPDINGEDVELQDLNVSGNLISFDLNLQFVRYLGAITDVNLGIYGLTAQDLNAMSLGVESNAYILGNLYVGGGANFASDLNVDQDANVGQSLSVIGRTWLHGDLNTARDVNIGGGIQAMAFYGDGSGLTGISSVSYPNVIPWVDVNVADDITIDTTKDANLTNVGISGNTYSQGNITITGNAGNINLSYGNDIQNFEKIYGRTDFTTGIYGGATLALGTGATGTGGGTSVIDISSSTVTIKQDFKPPSAGNINLGDSTHDFGNLWVRDINAAGDANFEGVLRGKQNAPLYIESDLNALDTNLMNLGIAGKYFGDGSSLTGISSASDTNANTECANYSQVLGGTGVCLDLNVGHASSTGASHSYIDQDVTNAASPEFGNILFELGSGNELTLTGQGSGSSTLTLDTSDTSRTLTINGNATIADWFNQSVKTTASPTFSAPTVSNLTIDLANQNQRILDRGDYWLVIESQNSGDQQSFEVATKDGDGTDNMNMVMWAEGQPVAGTITNRSFLQYGFITDAVIANRYFKLQGASGGTGNSYPLIIYTEANTNQVRLNTDGTILLATVYDDDIGTERDLLIQADGQIGYDSSSAEFKENIVDLPNTESEKLYQLQPRLYDKISGPKDQIGFIAEEVNEIFPQFVSYKRQEIMGTCIDSIDQTEFECVKDYSLTNIPETVNYRKLIVPAIQEIKKTEQRTTACEQRLDKIENCIATAKDFITLQECMK